MGASNRSDPIANIEKSQRKEIKMEPRRPAAGVSATKLHILDRPLSRGKSEVSLSAFAFLFSEMVQYFQGRVQNISDLETRLNDAGFGVGVRFLELMCHREKAGRRETRLIGMLQFIVSSCWKTLFGKAADALERSTENEDEYMIHELEPLTNKFISVPPDLGQLDCASYIAGMIRGILMSGGFPAQVTAHAVEVGNGQRDKTVFLVKFDEAVIRRERVLT